MLSLTGLFLGIRSFLSNCSSHNFSQMPKEHKYFKHKYLLSHLIEQPKIEEVVES